MTAHNILVTAVPFAKRDPRPLSLLKSSGHSFRLNMADRQLTEDEMVQMVPGHSIIIAGTDPITRRVMQAAPTLKLVSRVGIGLDSVDLVAARELGIAVAYTPDGPSPAAAELTIGFMIDLLRGINLCDRSIRSGGWQRILGGRLALSTIGVLGVGRIGKLVIRHLCGGFPGVRILANDIYPDRKFGEEFGVTWVDKETLFRDSDIITLHIPLSKSTKHLVDKNLMSLMKTSGKLINTSRGGIVQEQDLAQALRNNVFEAAAIDVFENEPYCGELVELNNCTLTCHMGSMSEDCRAAMEIGATEDALRFARDMSLERPVPESEYESAAA